MATRWLDYYVANEADGGHLEALSDKDHSNLAKLAKAFHGDSNKVAGTLSSSRGSNMIMIPTSEKESTCISCVITCAHKMRPFHAVN